MPSLAQLSSQREGKRKEKVSNMSGEFLGISENSVHKQRVIIPSGFKKKFSEAAKNTVVVTKGALNIIAIYPIDVWREMVMEAKGGSEKERLHRSQLIFFAQAEQVLEGPGRVKIQNMLLEEAGITDTVIIKGEGHYISLWNPEKYKEERKAKLELHQKTFTSEDYQT